MYECFAIIAEMESAPIINDPVHLDALVLAGRERRDGESSIGRPLSCLYHRDGFYQASAALVVVDDMFGMGQKAVTRVRGARVLHMPANLFNDPARETKAYLREMSVYRNGMRDYGARTNVRALVWLAVGDPRETLSLLSEVSAIGAGHRTGHGMVREWSVLRCAADSKTHGLVHDGRALRNIPFALASKLGADVTYSGMGRIEPRYGAAEDRQPIVAPSLQAMVVTSERAAEIAGLASIYGGGEMAIAI